MTNLIDDDEIVPQLVSKISALNLSAEKTQVLAMHLKMALNGDVSASGVITQLESRLDSLSISDDLREYILLIVVMSLIEKNRIVSVDTLTDLDVDISPGSIFFIRDENAPFIKKSNGDWVRLVKEKPKTNAYAWGAFRFYKGTGSGLDTSSPVSILGGFTDWIEVSTTVTNTHGLRANGTAWSWGFNGNGRLGDGTEIVRISPVLIAGGFTDWISVKAGFAFGVGLRANGTVWSWGSNGNGRLGDGTTTDRSSPVSVLGGFTDWVQISVGLRHTLGIRTNGTIWSWGQNTDGRVGDNSTTDKSSPVSVVGGFTDWIQVSAGQDHSAGIRSNGTAWVWGNNANGKLGTNNTTNRSSPVSVVGGFIDWISMSAGGGHTLGLRSNGTAWAWGWNGEGRLGDGTTTQRSSPVLVSGGFTDWVYVSAGNSSHGIRANGTLWSWGRNEIGALGDGTTTNRSSPVSVIGGFTDWILVETSYATADMHVQAIRASSE